MIETLQVSAGEKVIKVMMNQGSSSEDGKK